MERFAFIFHPLTVRDFGRKFPVLNLLPRRLVEQTMKFVPPFKVSTIRGVRSLTGKEAEGWFIALPMTPRVLLGSAYEDFVLPRLVRAGRLAEELGAGILGLGAFTKIAGDRGVSLAQNLSIPVTTGNSYTAATAVEGTLAAADRLGVAKGDRHAAIIGATGTIGRACAHLLAAESAKLTLVARDAARLESLKGELRGCKAEVDVNQDTKAAVKEANMVITVSSAPGVLLEAQDLRAGAVVCDVSRPRNVSAEVYGRRNDVLVMDGGVIRVPGDVEFGLDFGFPPGMAEACMAETMILALEGRYEAYTLGAHVDTDKVREIGMLAHKHGFSLAGFRRFERAISDQEVEDIKRQAKLAHA